VHTIVILECVFLTPKEDYNLLMYCTWRCRNMSVLKREFTRVCIDVCGLNFLCWIFSFSFHQAHFKQK